MPPGEQVVVRRAAGAVRSGGVRALRGLPAVLGSVLLAVVSATVSLAGVELWFRHRYGTPKPFYEEDAEVGWVHLPNLRRPFPTEGGVVTLETDARGFRPPFHTAPTGRPSVLLLGDSFLDGMDVSAEQHFATLLEQSRPTLEIVNAGVSGYSTLQELLLGRRLAAEMRPVARLLFVYGNDVHDNVTPFFPLLGPRPYVDADGSERPPDWSTYAGTLPPAPFARWLHWHSAAFFRWEFVRAEQHHDEATAYLWRWANRFSMKARWAVLERVVGEMAADGPLLVVSCPAREAVGDGTHALADVIAGIGSRLGVPVLDLQPGLTVADYWQHNIHWNADGHRKVAATLVPALDALLARAGARAARGF